MKDTVEGNRNDIEPNGHGQGQADKGYNRRRSRSIAAARTDVHDETVRTAVFLKRLFMVITIM